MNGIIVKPVVEVDIRTVPWSAGVCHGDSAGGVKGAVPATLIVYKRIAQTNLKIKLQISLGNAIPACPHRIWP
jgi:hypothetical protein